MKSEAKLRIITLFSALLPILILFALHNDAGTMVTNVLTAGMVVGFLVGVGLPAVSSNWLFMKNLKEIEGFCEEIKYGNYQYQLVVPQQEHDSEEENEFTSIMRNLNWMARQIELRQQNIEESLKIISESKEELAKTLNEVQKLKDQQDGDYFLTSLLSKPLSGIFLHNNYPTSISTEVLLKQKKQFSFRSRDHEIGGDINIVDDITLNSKRYTVFFNGDAMGKSIQGAGGVLVAGTVFRSIVHRAKGSTNIDTFPEIWLGHSYKELQNVFVTFDGSMLISAIFGLVDNETGVVYYINSEHPAFVSYLDGRARFIDDDEMMMMKMGTDLEMETMVQVYQMKNGEILLSGSDGRDDLLLGFNDKGRKIINGDQNLFLMHVEKANANLEEVETVLRETGDLTDDLSLLKIEFQKPSSPNSLESEMQQFLEDKKEASQFFQDFLEHRKDEKLAFMGLIKDYMKKRNYEIAETLLDYFISLDPSNTEFLYYNSFAKKKNKRYQQAAILGKVVLLRQPHNLINLINLTHIYFLLERYNKALDILQKATRIQADHPKVL
ncbi:MAG: SpoIIE family protein phosphatase, partial [Spirochaetota bacterium]